MRFKKKAASKVNRNNMIATAGPIRGGVIRVASIGFLTAVITKLANPDRLLSREDPNATRGSLQKAISALPGTLPSQSESRVYVGVPRINVLKSQAAKNVNTNIWAIEKTREIV